jgi:hypothetical protein
MAKHLSENCCCKQAAKPERAARLGLLASWRLSTPIRPLSQKTDALLKIALSIDESFGFPLLLYPRYEVSDFYLGEFASH